MKETSGESRGKKLYATLLGAAVFSVCLVLFLFFILPVLAGNFYISLILCVAASIGILMLIALYACVVNILYFGGNAPKNFIPFKIFLKASLPVMEFFGKFFGHGKDQIKNIYIKINNSIVLRHLSICAAQDILLLLPHCLQASKCRKRLFYEINNCAHCGACPIGEILDLAKIYGFRVAIASGGTIARRIISETRPRCVIAVACERDLCSGIQDCYPLPVFGVLNERPCGPCRDTRVSINQIRQALSFCKK